MSTNNTHAPCVVLCSVVRSRTENIRKVKCYLTFRNFFVNLTSNHSRTTIRLTLIALFVSQIMNILKFEAHVIYNHK